MQPKDNIKDLRKIFSDTFFNIPDYQRGFAWKIKDKKDKKNNQLEDLWNDILNIKNDSYHYTGSIKVVKDSRKEDTFDIVDGQQRITSILILLWVLIQNIEETEIIKAKLGTKKDIIKKFFKQDLGEQLKYRFNYSDKISDNYIKNKIFIEYNTKGKNIENLTQTLYTNNLLNAKSFFYDKIEDYKEDKIILLEKITKKLLFHYLELGAEDVHIIFETENQRGKKLSNLELLKNRLLYITTIINNQKGFDNEEEFNEITKKINDTWITIYRYLGMNKEKPLNDDDFIKNHWIMFNRYARNEADFPENDIFYKDFNVNEITKDHKKAIEKINKYTESLEKSIKQWYIINYPYLAFRNELNGKEDEYSLDKKTALLLEKLDRIGQRHFKPLILAGLTKENFNEKEELLEAIERHIFLIFNISKRRSNTGSYHFSARASEFYKDFWDDPDYTIIGNINHWVNGNDEWDGYFDFNRFIYNLIEERYKVWDIFVFIKDEEYIFQEYELYLLQEQNFDITTIDINKKYEIKSLNKSKNMTFGNTYLSKKDGQSQSEKEINENYNIDDLKNRCRKILEFIEKRWNTTISENYKLKLLELEEKYN